MQNGLIRTNDLSLRIKKYRGLLHQVFQSVSDTGWFVMGPEVERFERSFADYLGVRHCITLANGTDAIELALRALGVERGDRVATVANAGMYTSTALLAIGAEPFFLDVDLISHNTTLAEVERALAADVRAVVVTHLYGRAVKDIREIAQICAQHHVALLEDCAQAHGARIANKCVGSFGDAASFSFYPTKNLGALGDGGAVVTNISEIARQISRLRQYGWGAKYNTEIMGARNSRLDELQAAILSLFLPDLNAANARRCAISTSYSRAIRHPHIRVPAEYGEDYVAHLYVIQTTQRDSLRAHLRSCNIETEVHYPIPDHRQLIFTSRYSDVSLENTERLSGEVLTLPCYPELTYKQVDHIINAVNIWPREPLNNGSI